MQIKTIHKLQYALDTSVKILKFVWRHLLVLAMFWMLIEILIEGHTPKIEREFVVFVVAAFLDFIKIKIKFTASNGNYAQDQMFDSARRNMDSSRFGSSAWATNPAMAGSPANHLYNLGYSSTNYY